jgi:uncharacterized protein (UPF0147 family)
MHPKTLAASILCQQIDKSDAKSIAYAALTEGVYDMAHSDNTPLHHRIALWHTAHNGELEIDI